MQSQITRRPRDNNDEGGRWQFAGCKKKKKVESLKMAGGILHGSGNERGRDLVACELPATVIAEKVPSPEGTGGWPISGSAITCPHVGEHWTAGHDIAASSDPVSLFHWLPFERWLSRSKPRLCNASMSVLCSQPFVQVFGSHKFRMSVAIDKQTRHSGMKRFWGFAV